MVRTGVPTVGDLVRVARHHLSIRGGRLGHLLRRSPGKGAEVRFFDGRVTWLNEYDVLLERVENLNDEEVAALMTVNLKGQA